MYSRKEYMDVSLQDQAAAHRRYYGQFITPMIRSLVLLHFTAKTLAAAYKQDTSFNTELTPLRTWDALGTCIPYHKDVIRMLHSCGDYLTQCGKVCILKEAAAQIAEEYIASGEGVINE